MTTKKKTAGTHCDCCKQPTSIDDLKQFKRGILVSNCCPGCYAANTKKK